MTVSTFQFVLLCSCTDQNCKLIVADINLTVSLLSFIVCEAMALLKSLLSQPYWKSIPLLTLCCLHTKQDLNYITGQSVSAFVQNIFEIGTYAYWLLWFCCYASQQKQKAKQMHSGECLQSSTIT